MWFNKSGPHICSFLKKNKKSILVWTPFGGQELIKQLKPNGNRKRTHKRKVGISTPSGRFLKAFCRINGRDIRDDGPIFSSYSVTWQTRPGSQNWTHTSQSHQSLARVGESPPSIESAYHPNQRPHHPLPFTGTLFYLSIITIFLNIHSQIDNIITIISITNVVHNNRKWDLHIYIYIL